LQLLLFAVAAAAAAARNRPDVAAGDDAVFFASRIVAREMFAFSGRFFGIFDERYIDRRRFKVSDQPFSLLYTNRCTAGWSVLFILSAF